MKNKIGSGVFLAAAFLLAGIPAAGASDILQEGLTLHKRSSTSGIPGQQGQGQTSTMYLNSNSIREVSSDGTELIIFHQDRKLVQINHNKKTYSELSFDELQAKLDAVSDEIRRQAEEDGESMQQLQQMLGGKAGEISLHVEGPGEEVAGFRTQVYRLEMQPLNLRIWAAPELKVPAVYYDSLKIHAKPNPLFDMEKMFETFKQIDGLSLRTEVQMKVMGLEIKSMDEVVKVERGPVPVPSIPEGYTLAEVDF